MLVCLDNVSMTKKKRNILRFAKSDAYELKGDFMKKKIIAIALGLTLCLGMTGCTCEGSKNYDNSSKLISIEGEKDLYYYGTTHIVYIVFNECVGNMGYGYMSPYYSGNGKLCTYDTNTKRIIEIGE